MHLTGKIFAFFTFGLAIAAVILTAKTLDRQNEWNQRVEKAREDYLKTVQQLPDAKAQVDRLEGELANARLGWGRHWDDVQVSAFAGNANGQINIGIGTNSGMGRRTANGDEFPTLYGFQKDSNGEWSYVGEFRITDIGPTQAALQLSREPRPGETAGWNFAERWRFRDGFPASKRKVIADLLLSMTTAQQRVADRQRFLQIQEQSVASAQKALDNRLKELNGDPQADPKLGDEYTLGLVTALVNAEKVRDAELALVQSLRGELQRLRVQFESLIGQNAELENQLRSQSKTALGENAPSNN